MRFKYIVDHVDTDNIARDHLSDFVYYESPYSGTRYDNLGVPISYRDSLGRRVDFNGDPTHEDD